jgi:fatty-acid desaturase
VVDAVEAMDVFHHPYAYAASRGVEYWQEDRTEMDVSDA